MARKGWTRPEDVPFPKTWVKFPGLKPMANGSVPDFWIQDLTEEFYEASLDIMCVHYLSESAMARPAGVSTDAVSVQESRDNWRRVLDERISLVALTTGEDGKPVVAGCNILTVISRGDTNPEPEYRAEQRRRYARAISHIGSKVDLFARYGVDKYLWALGLCVLPEYRGQGLGLRLLQMREPLCRQFGILTTATVFSTIAAQKLAHRADYDLLLEERYEDYRDPDGLAIFAGSHGVSYKLMGKKIPSA